MDGYSKAEKDVLTRLQHGVAPVARPFQELALPEHEVNKRLLATTAYSQAIEAL